MAQKPPLAPRLVAYLKAQKYEMKPYQGGERKLYATVKETKLKQKALAAGYRLAEISAALKHMDEKLFYIGSWWDSKERCVWWTYYDMTPEEIMEHQEADEWFESLPDHPPKK